MQEEKDFNLDSTFFDEFIENLENNEIIEEKLERFFQKNEIKSQIEIILSSYHQIDGERGDVYDFSIEEGSVSYQFKNNIITGNLIMSYEAHYYYGCDDMNNSNEYTMDFIFTITNNIIKIVGENWPIREPDEY